jgi:hypothetical protein
MAATVAVCLAALTMFASCEVIDNSSQDVEITSITLDPTTLTLAAGETATLTATLTPSNASDCTLTWMSVDAKVAVVDNKGFVEAIGEGKTNIYVETSSGLTATCKVTVGGSGSVSTGPFTKKTFKNERELYEFIPEGVFLFRSITTVDDLLAKCADGSFTRAEIRNPTTSGNSLDGKVGDILNYNIWQGVNHYRLFFQINGETNRTEYFRHEGNFLAEHALGLCDTIKSITSSSNYYTGLSLAISALSAFSVLYMKQWSFAYFICNDDCETATYEKDDIVAGIACKKYVKNNRQYWVLPNGFCLKIVNYGTTVLEVIEGSLSTTTCDAVLQQYYKDPDITTPSIVPLSSIPTIALLKEAAMVSSSNSWVVPWTAGNIYISFAVGNLKDGMTKWEIQFKDVLPTDAQVAEYEARVKQIPDFIVTESYSNSTASEWAGSNSCLAKGAVCTHKLGDVIPTIDYNISFMPSFASTPSLNRIVINSGKTLHL